MNAHQPNKVLDGLRAADRTVAIVGAGSIGVAFAIVFAQAGWPVHVFDPDDERREVALRDVHARMKDLARFDLLVEPAASIVARITMVGDLDLALQHAFFVQECAPEDLAIKRAIFTNLDQRALPDAILASASSAITASSFASGLAGRARCLVTHPGNPPYLLPVVEIVPAPFTSVETVDTASALFEHAGLHPIRVQREIEGFVFNRLQGALLREAYCLVRDGVVSVEDLDVLVRDGLGRRWSVIGPFETVDLNTRGGIASHAQKLGPAYARMGAERGQDDPWTPELVDAVNAQRRALVPLDQWEARVAWRDEALMQLARVHRNIVAQEISHDA